MSELWQIDKKLTSKVSLNLHTSSNTVHNMQQRNKQGLKVTCSLFSFSNHPLSDFMLSVEYPKRSVCRLGTFSSLHGAAYQKFLTKLASLKHTCLQILTQQSIHV